ncbi:MAG: hypothetical protein HYT31_03665 [Parcubacteria group bacterium]|nr:hypothetical protein [Parcubacteria group bacterium]
MAIAVVACRDKAVTTLNDIVTDTVIEVAVASLAQDIKAGDAGNWSYADSYGPTWTANTKARHAIFADHLGEDWFDLVYDNKTDYRERAMRIARESLDTPEELWAAYLRHKAKVIAEIRKHGIQDDVVRYSTAALPYFSPPGGEELTDPHGDHGAKEWAERRRTEGGDALVVAWGEVIADLASSL